MSGLYSNGLYSDPYLKALLEEEHKLAKEFLDAIANSEFVKETEVITCIDVPGWVLEQAGVDACQHPNFPAQEFEKFLKDEEFVSQHKWRIFGSPHMNQLHIDKLMLSPNDDVRGMALMHPLGDSSGLLDYLKQMSSEHNLAFNLIYHICANALLTDEIFALLINAPDHNGLGKNIGESLWKNSKLTAEQKAALVLAEIKPAKETAKDYWGYQDFYFISSIPFLHLFSAHLPYYKSQKFDTIPKMKQSIADFFTKAGHHLSVVLPQAPDGDTEIILEGLQELISLELLHRMFWTDLCQREDFDIYRRNAYRTDDLFISHEILGREFDETSADEATKIGGVLYYDDQGWIVGEEELSEYRAAVLLSSYGEPMVTILESGNYESIGQSLVALSCDDPDIRKKYGIEVTDAGLNWMVEAAWEIAEPDDFDVSADLNPDFGEILSWAKLPDSKKEKIFEFLNLGFNHKESKLRNDSIHFLGCMALHESTPKTILEKLAKLNDPLVDEVLASRNH